MTTSPPHSIKQPWYKPRWDGIRQAFKREIDKRLVQAVLIIAGSILIWVFGLKAPDRGKAPLKDYVILLLRANWRSGLLILFVTLVLVALYVLVRSILEGLKSLRTEQAIKKDVGLLNFFPVSRYGPTGSAQPNADMRERAEQQIITVVQGAANVDMVLVSGYRVLGTLDNPGFLKPVLEARRSARSRLMLLDPACTIPGMEDRAIGIGKTLEDYVGGMRQVLEHLAWLQLRIRIPLRVWIYREMPTFQIFKTADEIWVQSAVAYRTEDSPLCGFEKSPYSLYWSLERFWDRMWEMWGGDEKELDLKPYFPAVGDG